LDDNARHARIRAIAEWFDETNERRTRIPALLVELVELGVPYTTISALTGVPGSTAHARVHEFRNRKG
jgi:hypothetical protein